MRIRYARGPAPGNFFWGRMNFWGERTGAIPGPSAVDFQWSADGRSSGIVRRGFSGISKRARFRNHPPGVFRDQQTGAFPEPSAVDFQWSADGRDSGTVRRGGSEVGEWRNWMAIVGILGRESNFYLVAAIAPPGGGLPPKKQVTPGNCLFWRTEWRQWPAFCPL